jgi:nucleotide-binding universal stress UspA family protein
MQVQSILVPIDFSEGSTQALAVAREMAHRLGASMHLLTVVDVPIMPPPMIGAATLPSITPERLLTDAQAAVDKLAHEQEQYGVTAIGAARLGFVGEEIVSYAGSYGVDLIIMATHCRTGLAHAVLGSKTEAVMRRARCPVLTIRPGARLPISPRVVEAAATPTC